MYKKRKKKPKTQLTSDAQENITKIEWTVTGKVRKVTQSDGGTTEFIYDAMGMRVMKIDGGINAVDSVHTYYVYDASDNVMSTYSRLIEVDHTSGTEVYYNDNLTLGTRMIYGSSRIGVKNENRVMSLRTFKIDTAPEPDQLTELTLTDYDSLFEKTKREVAEKSYELSNHLGNVLEVVTDQKIPNTAEDGYEADIISYSDYYPFGMMMPGRHGVIAGDNYRYGFQGQEHDDEIKGEGNSVNYKYRMHDPRIGRFFAVDPLTAKYPHYTPYSFSGNRVIDAVELEGLEPIKQGVLEGYNVSEVLTIEDFAEGQKRFLAYVSAQHGLWYKQWDAEEIVKVSI